MSRPTAIDLFCGAGGLSLGLEQAGFDVVLAADIDPVHCATHKYNFPDCAIICADVTEITGKQIRKKIASKNKQELTLVAGGSPCQGYSLIGKRDKKDPRNKLIHEFVRIVNELNPKYFLFENVKGMSIGKHKSHLDELIKEFQKIGYKVVQPYKILNAAEFGVPQDRKRLFLIGARKDQIIPEYPKPITKPRDRHCNDNGLPESPSVADAIKDLPNISRYKKLLHSDSEYVKFKKRSEYASYLHNIKNDPEDYSIKRTWDNNLLTSSLMTVHSDETKKRFKSTPNGKAEKISRFYKLKNDGISNTLRAGTTSEHGNHTAPRPIHPTQARCITVREAARLHSYPDWFRFHSTKWHGFRQVGNSVPPLLARHVASKIIEASNIKVKRGKTKIDLGDCNLLSLNKTESYEYIYALDK